MRYRAETLVQAELATGILRLVKAYLYEAVNTKGNEEEGLLWDRRIVRKKNNRKKRKTVRKKIRSVKRWVPRTKPGTSPKPLPTNQHKGKDRLTSPSSDGVEVERANKFGKAGNTLWRKKKAIVKPVVQEWKVPSLPSRAPVAINTRGRLKVPRDKEPAEDLPPPPPKKNPPSVSCSSDTTEIPETEVLHLLCPPL